MMPATLDMQAESLIYRAIAARKGHEPAAASPRVARCTIATGGMTTMPYWAIAAMISYGAACRLCTGRY